MLPFGRVQASGEPLAPRSPIAHCVLARRCIVLVQSAAGTVYGVLWNLALSELDEYSDVGLFSALCGLYMVHR